jgi:hypothetical protein
MSGKLPSVIDCTNGISTENVCSKLNYSCHISEVPCGVGGQVRTLAGVHTMDFDTDGQLGRWV